MLFKNLFAIIALALTISSLHASDKKQGKKRKPESSDYSPSKRAKTEESPSVNASAPTPIATPAPSSMYDLRTHFSADLWKIVDDYKQDFSPTPISSCNSCDVSDCCFSNDGKELVFIKTLEDEVYNTIVFHDIVSNTTRLESTNDPFYNYKLDLNHDDSLLAVARSNGLGGIAIDIRDAHTGEKKSKLELKGTPIHTVKFNPLGTAIAGCTDSIWVYDITKQKAAGYGYAQNFGPRDVVWFNDGKTMASISSEAIIAIGSEKTVYIWDANSAGKKPVSTIKAAVSDNYSKAIPDKLVITPDNKQLVASCNKSIVILDLAANKVLHTIPAPAREYFSSIVLADVDDNAYIAAATTTSKALLKYDLKTQKQFDSPDESALKKYDDKGFYKLIYAHKKRYFAAQRWCFDSSSPPITLWQQQKLPMTYPLLLGS